MDHAGWVASNIAAKKKRPPRAAERNGLLLRKGWHSAPDVLSPFQVRAFNILGIVGNGIYNAPIGWGGVVWERRFLIVPWRNSLATFDHAALTTLVFLCHDARIRCDISSGAPRHVEIMLHERKADGRMGERHPNLEEAIAAYRRYVPSDHSVAYGVEPAPAVAA